MPDSKGKVNRSLDLCLIAKETTGDCEQGFVNIFLSVGKDYLLVESALPTCEQKESMQKRKPQK